MKDAKTMKPHHVSMAKRNNVWVARECAKLAREILGANGVVNEYPVFRHMANIESVYTYEGTHDIHTLDHRRSRDGDRLLQPARWSRGVRAESALTRLSLHVRRSGTISLE